MITHPSSMKQAEQSKMSEVLISGAGFAGLSTAYWMTTLGYRVTVIDVARGLRKGGTPVDIEGETIGVLASMGMLDAVRAKALPVRQLEFKDAADKTIATLGNPAGPDGEHIERYEIHRDDLLEVLFAQVENAATVVFSRSISQMEEQADGVAVTFTDGSRHKYALVFGCDGNRSNTRRLTFGDAENFTYFMGGYFFIKVVPITGLLPPNTSQIFSVAGRTALLNGYDNQTDIALVFRSQHEIEYDYRDRAQQRRMVHDHFDGLGWKVPAMLSHVDNGDDFYFDKVNQIRMPKWSKGRTALVGDAGYCVSPVAGMGGSMAIIGAARLANALKQHASNYARAFEAYHHGLCVFVEEVQERAVSQGMALMLPSNDAEIEERNRKLADSAIDL